ncbi:ATP-binding cassette domain-containing protein, partial [Jeotgalicoccus huakuii]|nr:ATP-binding cassette domain-containing protein [Jeotgalicoccus huakuii]
MTAIRPGSVTFENVTKKFGNFTALPDLSLTVEPGTLVTLLGPSGCGKTTLLNIISGLLQPTEGRILFDGQDVTGLATEDRNIAQVFQFPVA